MTCRSNRLAMRKRLIVAFLVALANIPLAYAQEGPAHKINPFEFPVTISKCQPSAVDNKHDPNPAVRVDIAVDNNGFTVAHHMANGVTYIRGEQYAVRAFRQKRSQYRNLDWASSKRSRCCDGRLFAVRPRRDQRQVALLGGRRQSREALDHRPS
jgi:hypothetical protein